MKVYLNYIMLVILATALIFAYETLAHISVNVADLDPLKDCKRRDVALVESGNKVYMYGGQSWVKNGTQRPVRVTNHYLRIADFASARDLGDSSLLSVRDVPINVPVYKTGAFWVDSNILFVAGGEIDEQPWLSRQGQFLQSEYPDKKFEAVLKYDIDTDIWTSEPAAPLNNGSGITDAFCCGSFAYNAQSRRAYYYSGTNFPGSRRLAPNKPPSYVGIKIQDAVGNGNLLTFDTKSFTWSNTTTNNQLTTTGTERGQFVYLPGTQSSSGGTAIVLGGRRKDKNDMESMRKVLVYDSATGSWYGQATTAEGEFPDGRFSFCAVAASAPDNSSHNIYVYGGESPDHNPNRIPEAYSDMWVLSVPSFHWIRVQIDSLPRKAFGCTTIAQKYLVAYGGVETGWGDDGDEDECDQENQGLRLFDMSRLAWTARYDGPASGQQAYRVPKLIYDTIGGNEQGSATRTAPSAGFETASLAALFQKSSSTTDSKPPPPTSSATSVKKTNIEAIVGSAIGGVAVLAIVALGIFCFRKRRENAAALSAASGAEDDSRNSVRSSGEDETNKSGVHEMSGGHDAARYEMSGGFDASPHELYADTAFPQPRHQRLFEM